MQTKSLQITPNGIMPRINASQYDTGREVHFLLYDGTTPFIPPTGSIIRIEGTKSDGTGFSYECSYIGNNVTVIVNEQMTVFAEDVICELRIAKDMADIGTINFVLAVEKSALSSDIPISDTEIPAIIELARDEQYNAEAWARGTRNGVPVSSDDPAYHNNAKYWAENSEHATFGSLTDVDINNLQDGQIPKYNASTQKWENAPDAGGTVVEPNPQELASDVLSKIKIDNTVFALASGGLLPHLYIDSEPESVVTVVAPDSSVIVPTQISSGHWECDLPDYGVYTIHAVINGDDAVMTLTVDDVKEYHVTDAHYSYTLNVFAPVGSTIRVTDGASETYTGTGAGSTAVVFALHQASTSYTIQVTIDGITKSDSVTTPSTSGGSTSKTIEFGTINVTLDADFIGETITCVNGGTTISKTASTTSLVFYPPTTGTWAISGEVSGTTYTVDAEVTSLSIPVSVVLQTVPNGSTVLPTDDIQTWLACAGITDKSYTTLAEVLADSTTLLALMSNNNAVDYLVRSTTWASGITADSTAMTDIGANNYCANTLLADSTWLNAICNSTYFDSVLNVKVPVMTSNTTPSGEVSASSEYDSYNKAYKAFDGRNSGTAGNWFTNKTLTGWIQYKFETTPMVLKKVMFRNSYQYAGSPKDFTILASNDNFASDSHTLYTGQNNDTTADHETVFNVSNSDAYLYYRLNIISCNTTSSLNSTGVAQLQFWGRVDV